jgi:hypothetical protein
MFLSHGRLVQAAPLNPQPGRPPNMNHFATILGEILAVLLIFATGFLLLAL